MCLGFRLQRLGFKQKQRFSVFGFQGYGLKSRKTNETSIIYQRSQLRLAAYTGDGHLSHSLNSFHGCYIGGYIGHYYTGD